MAVVSHRGRGDRRGRCVALRAVVTVVAIVAVLVVVAVEAVVTIVAIGVVLFNCAHWQSRPLSLSWLSWPL